MKKEPEKKPELDLAAQFPEIEKILQSEDFNKINRSFTAAYGHLEKITKERGGFGKLRDARKAMKAIERVMDLLRYLLKLKYELAEPGELPPQKKK